MGAALGGAGAGGAGRCGGRAAGWGGRAGAAGRGAARGGRGLGGSARGAREALGLVWVPLKNQQNGKTSPPFVTWQLFGTRCSYPRGMLGLCLLDTMTSESLMTHHVHHACHTDGPRSVVALSRSPLLI